MRLAVMTYLPISAVFFFLLVQIGYWVPSENFSYICCIFNLQLSIWASWQGRFTGSLIHHCGSVPHQFSCKEFQGVKKDIFMLKCIFFLCTLFHSADWVWVCIWYHFSLALKILVYHLLLGRSAGENSHILFIWNVIISSSFLKDIFNEYKIFVASYSFSTLHVFLPFWPPLFLRRGQLPFALFTSVCNVSLSSKYFQDFIFNFQKSGYYVLRQSFFVF